MDYVYLQQILSFSSSETVLISPSFLNDIFNGYRILDFQFSFRNLKCCCFFPASMDYDMTSIKFNNVIFHVCFQDYFSLVFSSLLIMYIRIDFFGWIIFGIWWAFWNSKFTYFTKFVKFSAIIFSKILFCTHFCFTSGNIIKWILDLF